MNDISAVDIAYNIEINMGLELFCKNLQKLALKSRNSLETISC